MIQDILAGPQWADVLGDADRRGLTPLFTSNMTPYGDIQLDTTRRLALGGGDPPPGRQRTRRDAVTGDSPLAGGSHNLAGTVGSTV